MVKHIDHFSSDGLTKQRKVDKNVEYFHELLSEQEKTDHFESKVMLDLGSLSKHIRQLINSEVEFTPVGPQLLPQMISRITPSDGWGNSNDSSKPVLVKGTLGDFVSPLPAGVKRSEVVGQMKFHPARVHGVRTPGALHEGIAFLFWEVNTCKGFWLLTDRNLFTFENVSVSFPVFVILGSQNLWGRKIIQKTLNKLLKGLVPGAPFVWRKHSNQSSLVSTYWDRKDAFKTASFLFTQKNHSLRVRHNKVLAGLLYQNPSWFSAIHAVTHAKPSTVASYMSQLREFSTFHNIHVEVTLRQIAGQQVCVHALAKWLQYRLHTVNYDTVVRATVAFSWFYKKLCNKTFSEVHGEEFRWLQAFRKRWQSENEGAAELTWQQMQKLLKLILEFDWSPFPAELIHKLALISLWGALRTNEAVELHKHKAQLVFLAGNRVLPADKITKDTFLSLELFDTKTGRGNKTITKLLPVFEDRPDLCAVLAFNSLTRGKTGSFFFDSKGKTLTTNKLDNLFRKFRVWLVKNHMPEFPLKSLTWYIFRVSYLNIAHTEMGVPLHFASDFAGHSNIKSTQHYVRRTTKQRKMKNATFLKSKLSENLL